MTEHLDPAGQASGGEAPTGEAPTGSAPTGWRRLHPLSPLLRGGLFFLVVAGIIIANLRDRFIGLFTRDESWFPEDGDGDPIEYLVEQGLVFVALAVLLGIIALIVFFSWLSWRFHTFQVTEDAVEARSGILFRQHRRAPLERIQSVNLQRPLLARMLGLTQVEVQTAGQGGKLVLNYLSNADAKLVREQILHRASRAQAGEATATVLDAGLASDFAVDHPGVTPPTAAPMAGALGGAGQIHPATTPLMASIEERAHEFIDADISEEARLSGNLVTVPPLRLLASIVLGWEVITVLVIAVGVIVTAVVGTVVSNEVWAPLMLSVLIPLGFAVIGIAFSQFNRGFQYTLSSARGAVRVGAGLTATRTDTIPLDRVHAVQVRQPMLWRPFGWWQIRITTAGFSVAQGGQAAVASIVMPVGLEADAVRVLRTLLPDGPSEDELRLGLTGDGSGYLGAGPRAGALLWFGRKRAGLRIVEAGEGTSLNIRKGWLTRSLSVVPVLRMQSLLLRRPFVHHLLGLAALQSHTVLGPVHTEMRGIALADAQRAFDRLATRIVQVQGAEAEYRAEAQEQAR